MEILLVRHTTPNIEKGICYGQADIDVTPSFNEELKIIQEEIQPKESDLVYSSPLLRCEKLATSLYESVTYDDKLKEINFGDWELQKWDDIDEKELNLWMNDFVSIAPTNGEAFTDLYKRVVDFIQQLPKTSKRIVIVTHAGVIRSFFCYKQNTPLEKAFDLKLSYGEILPLEF